MTVLLVALAAAIIAPGQIDGHGHGHSRLTAARMELSILSQAVELHRTRTGSAPSSAGGLHVLTEGPQRTLEKLPQDPWGNAYRYELRPDGRWTIYSTGSDGIDQGGGGDDVILGDKTYRGCETYGIGCPITREEVLGYGLLAVAALGLLGALASAVIGAVHFWRSMRRAR